MTGRGLAIRVGSGLLAVWGAITLVFLLTRLSADPAVLMSPPGATAEQIENTRRLLGLDVSLPEQYVRFLLDAVQGDLGESYYWRQPVTEMIGSRIGATVALAVTALGLAIVVGVPLGLVAAFHRGKPADRLLVTLSMVGQAVPSFWLAPVLILILSVELGLLPIGGMTGPQSFVLPAVTLASFQIAVLFRITRAAALDVLGQDFVKLARAKGAGEFRVGLGHVAPNTLLPVMTVIGLALANLIGGSVIVEVIFGWPGIGNLMVEAVAERDFPLVQGVALVFGVGYVTINTAVDLLYRVADPRLRVHA
ncbi:ABC transporter permease [Pseudonocardia nigra]|uniref:ABC transporter permease n=1 Tax=Pseudonocardia nigra TaxID=1921578 RepID=UPI001C5E4A1D|nr:ABC transporter permease [Pseudonocardia nigra]